jgi:hypothetical protein
MFDDDELAAMFTAALSQVKLDEAVARAPFTVLVPDRLPTGLKRLPYCRCGEASAVLPAFVTMFYVGGGENRSVVIQQMAAADVPRNYPAAWRDDESWREVEGTPVKIRGAGEGPEVRLGQQLYERWLSAGDPSITGDHRPWERQLGIGQQPGGQSGLVERPPWSMPGVPDAGVEHPPSESSQRTKSSAATTAGSTGFSPSARSACRSS